MPGRARHARIPRGLETHPATACAGEHCCVHNPSNHHMRSWRMLWRADRGMMERLCRHGVGHPDPDDVAHHLRLHPGDTFYAVHGCDGCCQPPGPPEKPKRKKRQTGVPRLNLQPLPPQEVQSEPQEADEVRDEEEI